MKLRRTQLPIALAFTLLGMGGTLVTPAATAAICKSVDNQGQVHYAQCQDDSSKKVAIKRSSEGVALVDTGSASRHDSKYGGAVVSAAPRQRLGAPPAADRKKQQQ